MASVIQTLEATILSLVGSVQNVDELATRCELLETEYMLTQTLPSEAGVFFAIQLSVYLRRRSTLPTAKFLWKRLPDALRSQSSDLQVVWGLGKRLWKREFAEFFSEVNSAQGFQNISTNTKVAIQTLGKCIQISQAHLLCQSYSSLKIALAMELCGFSTEADAIGKLTKFPGCTYEDAEKLFKFDQQVDHGMKSTANISLGQIDKLSRYILELERKVE